VADLRRAQGSLVLVWLVAVFVASACGSSASGNTKTVTEKTVTVVESQPASTTDPETSTDPSSAVVPSVVGERLDVAETKLDGLSIRYKEIGGGVFGIVVRSNWQVCQQIPKAGDETSGAVKLVVDRPGECSTVSGGAEKTIPGLAGERLDVAESKLDDLHIAYQEIGGGLFGIVVRSNWVVCETSPGAGATAESVKLIVDRPGNC
jgi:beta-lactam-binding protein with PASTA domain